MKGVNTSLNIETPVNTNCSKVESYFLLLPWSRNYPLKPPFLFSKNPFAFIHSFLYIIDRERRTILGSQTKRLVTKTHVIRDLFCPFLCLIMILSLPQSWQATQGSEQGAWKNCAEELLRIKGMVHGAEEKCFVLHLVVLKKDHALP